MIFYKRKTDKTADLVLASYLFFNLRWLSHIPTDGIQHKVFQIFTVLHFCTVFFFFKFVFLQSTEFLSEGTNLEITYANEIPTDKSWEIKNIKQNAAARSFTQTEKLTSPLPPYCKKGRESYSNKQYIRYNTFLFLHTWTASCTTITPNISKLFQTCARTLLIVRYTSLFPSKDIQQCQAKLSWMV